MKSDRLSELARIAEKGAIITYADTGFISPNRWLSSAIIREFEVKGWIERKDQRAVITTKGKKALETK